MNRTRLVPLIVATALFMENTDSTVIATSLPAIAASLNEDPIALKLAITSYLVSLAIFIPVSGWMADRYGARTVFRAALAVFMAGSIACAAAGSLGGFVAARFLQGMGGAMMVPVGRLVLLRSIPKSEMVSALAYLTVPAMVGPVVGPPLGGFITTYLDWRWIFFINIPIGLLGIVLSTLYFENIREPDRPPLDLAGFALSGFGLAALMLGLATGGRHLLPVEVSLGCVVAGTIAVIAYVRHARRIAHPLVRLDLLRIPTFRASVLGGSFFRIGVGAIPFLLPLMLQLGFGLNPFQSGLLTFVSAAGALFMKTLAARILRTFGFRAVLTVNAFIAAAFIGANGLFTPATPYAVIVVVLLVGGCFRSLQFTALNAIAYADVSNREMSHATGLTSVAQQLALSLGVALGAAVLETASRAQGETELRSGDFWPAFLLVALIAALSGFVLARLDPSAGAELSGHAIVRAKPAADST
ncbi:MAG TPA: DHA2 family efflux MFS transporter permease subunit [Beijerinckiaceae bacterium]|jgi:EmrB/QacA subfamily drug resistance transporter|nr:drug resistance transporter, EmrB/QacA subfamily [Microvirga sp.]HZB39232.1 DHA2 family efflux MFS transporter permease subunit [Beijerinckiaceae bacterium]